MTTADPSSVVCNNWCSYIEKYVRHVEKKVYVIFLPTITNSFMLTAFVEFCFSKGSRRASAGLACGIIVVPASGLGSLKNH